MTLAEVYARLGNASRLSQADADAIVAAALPMAFGALSRGHAHPSRLDVVAREVDPRVASGGSLIPAWPSRASDGQVIIEFVNDWGAMLATWRSLFDPAVSSDVDDLLHSGQRVWIGIANDVLQLFVPDPPPGTYSMVRHHALMLVAATVWLGPDSTRRWQAAHAIAARYFVRMASGDLWRSIEAAESALSELLADPRARQAAADVVAWLNGDPDALSAYQAYLGAASLGVAALLASDADWTPDHLSDLVLHQHSDPDFNRAEIERFALAVRA